MKKEKIMTCFRRMIFGFTAIFSLVYTIPVTNAGCGPGSGRSGIKVDEEIFELLNKQTIQLAPSQIAVFNECQREDAGLFFFITPIMTYLEAERGEQSVTRFFNAEQLDRAIRLKLKKQGTPLSMFCGHIVSETEKVKRGEYSYGDILSHILVCEKVCGPTMSAMASVYMFNSARYYEGLVRFNYDNADLYTQLRGDSSQGYLMINNQQPLEAVYKKWVESDRSLKIGLDARASQTGGQLYNDELSRKRLLAVQRWFTEAKDVPASMIDRKWFGNYGPFIDETIADLYRINDVYDQYRNNYQAEKSYLDGRDVYYGPNQSVAIFLYEDIDIHVDVAQVDKESTFGLEVPVGFDY